MPLQCFQGLQQLVLNEEILGRQAREEGAEKQ